MQDLDIQVGDRITFIYKNKEIIEFVGSSQLINKAKEKVEILKIERIGSNGWYTVYEKKKELLTEEERELLKVMIKNLCADIGYIKKSDEKVILIKNNGVEIAQIIIRDVILGFKNLEEDKEYSLSDLGLYKEYCECCGIELTKENKALANMCNECKYCSLENTSNIYVPITVVVNKSTKRMYLEGRPMLDAEGKPLLYEGE